LIDGPAESQTFRAIRFRYLCNFDRLLFRETPRSIGNGPGGVSRYLFISTTGSYPRAVIRKAASSELSPAGSIPQTKLRSF
jgi:hypothetical protein